MKVYLILSEGIFLTISFLRHAFNKLPETEWLKAAGIYSLTVLEARGQNQGVRHSWFLLKALGKNLFCASFLASGVDIPGHVAA